ncbi:zona pellucida sperm-binding protein 1 [Myxocyprinus asiaticus]|uniref:zona pellucida sperm-binding protein 1 n=1 Tax=Myxocyprinus asiaticus TaxID=70543 RepID=UPI002222247D|nr:zona pellucida sperm-binding protein 1 [Myxocyprinus asiaticus]
MLLGKPLYLEVRLLNPPDPTAMLLVHYCVAYPRSANSTWILIYDGCPNFLDKTPNHKPPAMPAEALTNHVRRFTITTFQFLPVGGNLQTDEEIYFMCSTEVCLPSDGPCVEGCFGDSSHVKED